MYAYTYILILCDARQSALVIQLNSWIYMYIYVNMYVYII